ncbi:hypothetical protein BC834DRAFT_165641 [Gloeopeniophorella convolvens]|nr:hypothetical protein BC834DRAFT_165641 [Gloeopeniophorella convolvens]
MLDQSPPLPLTIDYRLKGKASISDDSDEDDVDGNGEGGSAMEHGAVFALGYLPRVVNVLLDMRASQIKWVCSRMSTSTPRLETLHLSSEFGVTFTDTFLAGGAPQLCSLRLRGVICPFFSSPCLVELDIEESPFIGDATLLLDDFVEHLQSLPLLERLSLGMRELGPPRVGQDYQPGVGREPIPLHKLFSFRFRGSGANLHVLTDRLEAPHVRSLHLDLDPNEFPVSVVQFISRLRRFRPTSARLLFHGYCWVLDARDEGHLPSDSGEIFVSSGCSVAPIISLYGSLDFTFSTIEHLYIAATGPKRPLQVLWDEAMRINWSAVLAAFREIPELEVGEGFVCSVARALQMSGPSEMLPNLREFKVHSLDNPEAIGEPNIPALLRPLVSARAAAGRPVRLSYML